MKMANYVVIRNGDLLWLLGLFNIADIRYSQVVPVVQQVYIRTICEPLLKEGLAKACVYV